MKLTKAQMNEIAKRTRPELIGKQVSIRNELGFYSRVDWNWGYKAGWTNDVDLVVTRFGEVVDHI